jgi:hypothetical protein
VSNIDINNWKKSWKKLVNNINTQKNIYPLSKNRFLEKFGLSHITDIPLKQKLCELLWEFKDTFSTYEDDIGLIPFYEHAIQTICLPLAK